MLTVSKLTVAQAQGEGTDAQLSRLYDEITSPRTSPSATSPRFRNAEGGSPYDPMTRDAVGQMTKGHQPRAPESRSSDPLISVADDAVDSKVSRISFVIFRACTSMLAWELWCVESVSVIPSRRLMP